jgi:hypothetical protein
LLLDLGLSIIIGDMKIVLLRQAKGGLPRVRDVAAPPERLVAKKKPPEAASAWSSLLRSPERPKRQPGFCDAAVSLIEQDRGPLTPLVRIGAIVRFAF